MEVWKLTDKAEMLEMRANFVVINSGAKLNQVIGRPNETVNMRH